MLSNMFGRTGALQKGPPYKKGPPQARKCRTAARHFLACATVGASLCCLATFKNSLGAARDSLVYIWFSNSESRISNQVTAAKLHTCSCNAEFTVHYCQKICEGPHFYQTGPNQLINLY